MKEYTVKLRRWNLDDVSALAALLNNKNILNNLRDGIPYPYSEHDAKEFITEMQNADHNKTFAFAIVANDKLAGSIAAFRQNNIHFRTAELGYYIGQSYWGKGIASSAVRQICGFLFETTDLLRIFAEPFADNAASCRVLEKNGFQYEGTLKSNGVKNETVVDMKMYALIKKNS